MLSDFLTALSSAMKEEGLVPLPDQICDAARYLLAADSLSWDPNIYEALQPIFVKRNEDVDAYFRAWERLKQKCQKQNPLSFYRLLREPLVAEKLPEMAVPTPVKSGKNERIWRAWREYQIASSQEEDDCGRNFRTALLAALAKGDSFQNWEEEWERELHRRFLAAAGGPELDGFVEKAMAFRKEYQKIKNEWRTFLMAAAAAPAPVPPRSPDKIGEKQHLRPEFSEGCRANVLRWGDGELFRRPMEKLRESDLPPLQQAIRDMAQRLRLQLEGMREVRRGRIDMRGTMRKSLATFGEPLRLVRLRPKRKPAKWVVLSDVSGSVKRTVGLFMSFLFELRQVMDEDLRAFVFVGEVREITEILKAPQYEDMMDRLRRECEIDFRGYSDYGAAFRSFDLRASDCLDRETAFLVIGDARNNKRDPCLDILEKWTMRARKTIWFNPDLPGKWDQGDSIIGLYREAVREVHDVSTPEKCLQACYRVFSH